MEKTKKKVIQAREVLVEWELSGLLKLKKVRRNSPKQGRSTFVPWDCNTKSST
jgi:hypothetical protein